MGERELDSGGLETLVLVKGADGTLEDSALPYVEPTGAEACRRAGKLTAFRV